jgi:hypothetical protein
LFLQKPAYVNGGNFLIYTAPHIVRISESKMSGWPEHVSPMRERGINVKCRQGPLSRCPLRIPRTRWKSNVKVHLREAEYDCRRWMELTQYRAQLL